MSVSGFNVQPPIRKIIVLGGGSAGFIAALTLKRKIPALDVLVIRSKTIGIIGVGEGSTFALTSFLHSYLKIDVKKFFTIARPTFKLGLRFLWGTRPYFNYSFGATPDQNVDGLPQSSGFYANSDLEFEERYSAFMSLDKAFERGPSGPKIHQALAYHFENENFVRYLEEYAHALGVSIVDDTVREVRQDATGITSLALQSGKVEAADLYVDCSGFASLLLGQTLKEPFVKYDSSLFCDRAVVGGWTRGVEVIKPYTTCETMESGWCWQIEHEHRINRGYVYASAFVSDEKADAEFRSKNPLVTQTRVVRFSSGRYERNWVKNVVAIGNAAGFVEPLEATALGVLALQVRDLTQTLIESAMQPQPSQIACCNRVHALKWDCVRRFLAVHYKFNSRVLTDFWRACHAKLDLAGAEDVVDFYRENGPSPYWGPSLMDPSDQFGYGAYALLLMGQGVPFRKVREPSEHELTTWNAKRAAMKQAAERAMGVKEALAIIHSGKWQWVA